MGALRLRDEDLAQDCRGGSSARPRLEGSLAELGNALSGSSIVAVPGSIAGRRDLLCQVIGHISSDGLLLGKGCSGSSVSGLGLGLSSSLSQGLGQLALGGALTLLGPRT